MRSRETVMEGDAINDTVAEEKRSGSGRPGVFYNLLAVLFRRKRRGPDNGRRTVKNVCPQTFFKDKSLSPHRKYGEKPCQMGRCLHFNLESGDYSFHFI